MTDVIILPGAIFSFVKVEYWLGNKRPQIQFTNYFGPFTEEISVKMAEEIKSELKKHPMVFDVLVSTNTIQCWKDGNFFENFYTSKEETLANYL